MALIMQKKPQNAVRIKSFTSESWYVVDLDERTCQCPAFKKKNDTCKHMEALGIYVVKPFTPKTHPTFSQALSGLVKSIRIRRVEDAVYWMLYMNSFSDQAFRFRVARRLLIATAEDGHSLPVMEKCAENFSKLCKKETDLLYLVAEALRVCKLPNWWHPDSGGPDYIYQSMIGQRLWWHKKWSHTLKALQAEVIKAIDEKNRAEALGGIMAFGQLNKKEDTFGPTKQAEWLLELAENRENEIAARLCEVHLSCKSALSGDNNFLCQAVWHMAGGQSPVIDKIAPVTAGECYELIKQAEERWKNPQLIPGWCCDGIHCAGHDARFAGVFPQMMSVINAFKHYGRIDPDDKWLPEFYCLEGMQVEKI